MLSKLVVQLVLTGPKIPKSLVLEKFQKGDFSGHPVVDKISVTGKQ